MTKEKSLMIFQDTYKHPLFISKTREKSKGIATAQDE